MVEQKKRTRITQSGKTCAIHCAIQGMRLISKQDLIGHLKWVSLIINQSECLVCFLFLHWINSFLHCFKKKNCTALNQSKWRIFFMPIISSINNHIRKANKDTTTSSLQSSWREQVLRATTAQLYISTGARYQEPITIMLAPRLNLM